MRGSMENERMAEKLGDSDAYYQKWEKIELENQLNKSMREKNYSMVGCGFLYIIINNIKREKINHNIFLFIQYWLGTSNVFKFLSNKWANITIKIFLSFII